MGCTPAKPPPLHQPDTSFTPTGCECKPQTCQVCWRILRWHNGRSRRSGNLWSKTVSRDFLLKEEQSAAHPIVARRSRSPTKAEYICADQLASVTFRLQKSGGPYIYSATSRRVSARSWSIFAPPRTLRERAYTVCHRDGLFLLVNPSGSKLWRWRHRFDQKEKLMALGEYPVVTPGEARDRHLAVCRCGSWPRPAPDEAAILRFRQLLEKPVLCGWILTAMSRLQS